MRSAHARAASSVANTSEASGERTTIVPSIWTLGRKEPSFALTIVVRMAGVVAALFMRMNLASLAKACTL